MPAKPPAIEVSSFSPRPFADLVLDDPELAACFLVSPGLWTVVKPPKHAVDPEALKAALASHLATVLAPSIGLTVTVIQAGVDRNAAAAVVHGDTVLLLLPEMQRSDPQQAAGVAAEAVISSHLRPAAPDARCSEPLLALGEALSNAGALALAGLPPALRPVKDWLDVSESRVALDAVIREALDERRPWASRRAMLLQASRPGGLRPELAHPAAMLVEALGTDAALGSRSPYDLLLAWQAGGRPGLPPFPSALKKALGRSLQAGLPPVKATAEREAVLASANDRMLAAGGLPAPTTVHGIPEEARLRLAAALRAAGAVEICRGLSLSEVSPTILTGCRDDEPRGVVLVRPETSRGFAVVWLGQGRVEGPLLRWPRWLLHPVVNRLDGTLLFVDAQGVWRLPLDGSVPPALLLAGTYRQMALAPNSRNLAVACRDRAAVEVIRLSDATSRELPVDGRAGLAWLDADVLAVSDGRTITLAALDGALRPAVAPAACTTSLLPLGGATLAGIAGPCVPGIVRINPAEGTVSSVLKLADGPSGLAAEPDGAVVFSAVDGLFRWREGSPAERVGSGVTPGPG
jgi:hypothetical protein